MNTEKLSLPENLKVSDFPELEKLQGSIKTGLYKLVFPEGSKGKLLKVKSGEMKGHKTTTLVVDGKFVGTAGLEEVDLDDYSSRLLNKIKSYDYLAQGFNELSSRTQGLINRLDNEYQAKVRNMFGLFKDISRKMPEFINNDNYANLAMTNLAGLKIIAGEYFESQLIDFSSKYLHINYNQREASFHIRMLVECKNHPVFQALEMLVMIEIYEIMLSRQVTSRMIRAAKIGLEERFKPIENILSSISEYASRMIDQYDNESKGWQATYYEHLKYIDQVNDYKSNLQQVYFASLDVKTSISKSLNEELGMDNLESVYIEFVDENHLI